MTQEEFYKKAESAFACRAVCKHAAVFNGDRLCTKYDGNLRREESHVESEYYYMRDQFCIAAELLVLKGEISGWELP